MHPLLCIFIIIIVVVVVVIIIIIIITFLFCPISTHEFLPFSSNSLLHPTSRGKEDVGKKHLCGLPAGLNHNIESGNESTESTDIQAMLVVSVVCLYFFSSFNIFVCLIVCSFSRSIILVPGFWKV